MYTREIAEQIVMGLADGKTLRSICRQPGIPSHQTVLRWADQDLDGFAERYRKAREHGYLAMADEVLDLADESGTEPGEVQKARLRFDARRWLLSKALPKVFGDRLQLAGDPDAPLVIEIDDTRASIDSMLTEFQRGRVGDASAHAAEAPTEPAPRRKPSPAVSATEFALKRATTAAAGFDAPEPEGPPEPLPHRTVALAAATPDPLAAFRGTGFSDEPCDDR